MSSCVRSGGAPRVQRAAGGRNNRVSTCTSRIASLASAPPTARAATAPPGVPGALPARVRMRAGAHALIALSLTMAVAIVVPTRSLSLAVVLTIVAPAVVVVISIAVATRAIWSILPLLPTASTAFPAPLVATAVAGATVARLIAAVRWPPAVVGMGSLISPPRVGVRMRARRGPVVPVTDHRSMRGLARSLGDMGPHAERHTTVRPSQPHVHLFRNGAQVSRQLPELRVNTLQNVHVVAVVVGEHPDALHRRLASVPEPLDSWIA